MNTLMFAAANTLTEMEVEFPNLFGGTAITYRRGFNVFGITIYWYGVIIAIGVVLAFIYAMRRATKDYGLVKDRVFDVAFVCVIGGFLCARIYYCVFTELKNPGTYTFVTVFTKIRDGGIAMYGGIIGAALIGILMCKWRKVNFFAMVDLVAPGFLIGQTLGRWGNLINQEAYGAVCDDKWLFAMSGNMIRLDPDIPAGSFVHPCFLYESVWCLLGFIFLHFYSKKLRTFDGEIALLYLAWYGYGRANIEQLRTDSLYAGPLKVSQWVGIVSCVAAIGIFVIVKLRTRKSGKPLYVNSDASKALIESDMLKEEERKAKKEKKAESIIADDEADETEEVSETEEADKAEEADKTEKADKNDSSDKAEGSDKKETEKEDPEENNSEEANEENSAKKADEEKENENGSKDN